MGYVLRVRLASFFAGAATASFAGSISSTRISSVHESLDRRISSLEKLKQSEAPQPLQATE
ncbi:ABC transporter family protein [Salix suchowensis]|nr:ABC transporter family protein [Salix suchowensis]